MFGRECSKLFDSRLLELYKEEVDLFLLALCTLWVLDFFFNDTATTEIYTLSLHDALPILRPVLSCSSPQAASRCSDEIPAGISSEQRSEEHTSELQSHHDLVCRLLLE